MRVPWMALAAWAVVACSNQSKSDRAPLVTTGSACKPPTCGAEPPSAAVALARGPLSDAGSCPLPAEPFSLPTGDAAWRAIRECGGNQIRCGSANYRVGGGAGTDTVSCTLSGSAPVHVSGHASSGGLGFDVTGDLGATGGTATIDVTGGQDAAALGRMTCTATPQVLGTGAIYADFICPDVGAAGCATEGTFVFESCSSE